jgi:hypothetical protein
MGVALNLVNQYLETYFDANYVLTKYTFEDISFEAGQEPGSEESWVRMIIKYGTTENLEISKEGEGLRHGVINFELFTPKSAPRYNYTMAATIEALFRKKNINDIRTGEPYTSVLSRTTTVVVPFHVTTSS